MSVLFRRIVVDFGGVHVLKYATQLSCNFQHSHCTFVTILSRPFARLLINLAVCTRALFPKPASIFGLVEQAFWRMPFFTEWCGADSFEIILARQLSHFPTWASASRTSGSRRISLILLHERTRRRIRLCRFCTLNHIVTETAIVSFRTLPVGFPLPTVSQSSVFTLFCPLILDHGACFIISVSGLKILHSQILLDTSFYHRLQSVIIRSSFLLMNLHIVPFQYGLEFLRLPYSWFVQLSKISSDGICVIEKRISSHFESTYWISSFRRTTENRST